MTTAAGGSAPLSGDTRILERQLELTFARLPFVVAAFPLVGLLVTVALRDDVSATILATWFATLCLYAVANLLAGRAFGRLAKPDVSRWGSFRIALAVTNGLLWGGCLATFLYVPDDILLQTFVVFVVGGTTVTSMASSSGHPPSMLAFQVINVVPIALRLALEGDSAHLAMAGLIVAFLLVVMLIGLRVGKDQTRLIRMETENRALVEQLKEAHDDLRQANDDLSARVEERTSQLQQSLAEQEAQATQLRRAQRMEAVGRLAGGVAHDFNNVLTSIAGFAGLVHETLPEGDERREDIGEILAATERASSFTSQLLAFAKGGLTKPRVLDLATGIFQLETMLRRVLPDDVNLVWQTSKQPCRVLLDPGELDQLVMNLVVNACDAMPQGGTVSISVDREDRTLVDTKTTQHAVLRVRDTGTGISDELLEHVFDPFVSTKGTRGTGLGLTSCFGIVKRAGGVMRVQTEVGVGTVFTAYLPLTDLPDSIVPGTSAAPPDAPKASILVVDDEAAIVRMVSRVLRARGHEVLEADSAEAALDLVSSGTSKRLDLVLSDVVLPRKSGFELQQAFEKKGLRPRFLFMSGYIDQELQQRSGGVSDSALLRKPFSAARLAAAVSEALTSAEVVTHRAG